MTCRNKKDYLIIFIIVFLPLLITTNAYSDSDTERLDKFRNSLKSTNPRLSSNKIPNSSLKKFLPIDTSIRKLPNNYKGHSPAILWLFYGVSEIKKAPRGQFEEREEYDRRISQNEAFFNANYLHAVSVRPSRDGSNGVEKYYQPDKERFLFSVKDTVFITYKIKGSSKKDFNSLLSISSPEGSVQNYIASFEVDIPFNTAKKINNDIYVLIIGSVKGLVAEDGTTRRGINMNLYEIWVYNFKNGDILYKKQYRK